MLAESNAAAEQNDEERRRALVRGAFTHDHALQSIQV